MSDKKPETESRAWFDPSLTNYMHLPEGHWDGGFESDWCRQAVEEAHEWAEKFVTHERTSDRNVGQVADALARDIYLAIITEALRRVPQ